MVLNGKSIDCCPFVGLEHFWAIAKRSEKRRRWTRGLTPFGVMFYPIKTGLPIYCTEVIRRFCFRVCTRTRYFFIIILFSSMFNVVDSLSLSLPRILLLGACFISFFFLQIKFWDEYWFRGDTGLQQREQVRDQLVLCLKKNGIKSDLKGYVMEHRCVKLVPLSTL